MVDSKSAIARIINLEPGTGQWLALRIREHTQQLQKYVISTIIHCVPCHVNIKGNEQADQAAKEAARNSTCPRERFVSLAHVARLITERK